MQKKVVYTLLMSFSLFFAQEVEWENLLESSARSEYSRFLKAYQEMDFSLAEKTLFRLFQKHPSNAVILLSYHFLSQEEGFGIESLEYGLNKNLSLYTKRVLSSSLPLQDFLSRYIENPKDRLVTLIEMESQLKYVNWVVRLEIIKEHVKRNKDYVAALDKLSDLIGRYPRFPLLHFYRLFFLYKQRNWEAFDSTATTALRLFPKHPEILRVCGMASLERKRLEEAIQYYERALQSSPTWHADGMLELCSLYRDTKNIAKAMSLLQKARKLYPWKRELGVLEQQLLFGLQEGK
ncbi:MAG: tetratricopeptide repeat protein [Brevinematales bacterium]|nr:tetratricopeptide repeat protein [Brevinematales bacterium]